MWQCVCILLVIVEVEDGCTPGIPVERGTRDCACVGGCVCAHHPEGTSGTPTEREREGKRHACASVCVRMRGVVWSVCVYVCVRVCVCTCVHYLVRE